MRRTALVCSCCDVVCSCPALVCSCRHPERSEGPRRSSLTTTARTFLPRLITLLALASPLAHAAPKTILVNDLGAKGDGTTLDTAAIQKAIDTAAPKHETVSLKPGTYLTGALFLKSGVTLDIPEGVTLTGSQDIKDFPEMPTRMAGIELTWPVAMINVRDQHDVTITGKGTIDENGAVWWKVFSDLSRTYMSKGLRWAIDYDAKRVRLMLFQNSSNIHLGGGLNLRRSGFWTVQILYSHDVVVDGVNIRNNDGDKRGPSTDGIDIDSSHDVDISHADIDNNDDALCLKSGRDSDGLRVNKPTYNVKIHDSIIHRGPAAITIGSETSGGFHNIEAWNLTAEAGVGSGVLFKSAHIRGGNTTDIRIHDITLIGVATPINIDMNWNPSYSYATLPCGHRSQDRPTLLDRPHHTRPRGAGPPPLLQRPHLEHQGHRSPPRLLRLRLPQRPAHQLQVRPPRHPGRHRRLHRQRPGLDLLRHQAHHHRQQHHQSHRLHQRHRPARRPSSRRPQSPRQPQPRRPRSPLTHKVDHQTGCPTSRS